MDNRQPDLCRYRMEKAEQCLKSAKLLSESGDYEGSLNRSYYAVFNSVRSILALEGLDFSKHSGVISYFQKKNRFRRIRIESLVMDSILFVRLNYKNFIVAAYSL